MGTLRLYLGALCPLWVHCIHIWAHCIYIWVHCVHFGCIASIYGHIVSISGCILSTLGALHPYMGTLHLYLGASCPLWVHCIHIWAHCVYIWAHCIYFCTQCWLIVSDVLLLFNIYNSTLKAVDAGNAHTLVTISVSFIITSNIHQLASLACRKWWMVSKFFHVVADFFFF